MFVKNLKYSAHGCNSQELQERYPFSWDQIMILAKHAGNYHRRKIKPRQPRRCLYLMETQWICLILIATVFLLLLWIPPAAADEWTGGVMGHGTVHEELGQAHFTEAYYTQYISTVKYTLHRNRSTWPLNPFFDFTHTIFDNQINDKTALPSEYIAVKKEESVVLGPKVERNEWSDLLSQYWLLLFWVFFLLILIILMPFIAVCYCCFCCCRRCKQGCPPCDKDARKSLICSILLIVLVILILIFALVAFLSNRLMENNLEDTSKTMRRGSEDTCRYLKDVSRHLDHILLINYEELREHILDLLRGAHNHVFMDLSDTSETNALTELERIFDNMPEAARILKNVDYLLNRIIFESSQLRDGVRGAKRDINYACTQLIANGLCMEMLKESTLEYVDTSNCLHLDLVPKPTRHIQAIHKIIDDQVALLPKHAIRRYSVISGEIERSIEKILPPVTKDLIEGRDIFRAKDEKIKTIIDKVISNIEENTRHSTRSFEDVYEKFGQDRNLYAALSCVLVFAILTVLIIALICGCCGSKSTGANCLLIAIILIFCVFSFLVLISLIYFMVGLVAYQGACAPLRNTDNDNFLEKLNSIIDINQYLTPWKKKYEPKNHDSQLAQAIQACSGKQTIFNILDKHDIYKIEELRHVVIIESDSDSWQLLKFDTDLSNTYLFTEDERKAIVKVAYGNLSDYHMLMYTKNMCMKLTPSLPNLLATMKVVRDDIYVDYRIADHWNRYGKVSLSNDMVNIQTFDKKWTNSIKSNLRKLKENLEEVDRLILYENRNFSNSIIVLFNAVLRAEQFLRVKGASFINDLVLNLTNVVHEQTERYVDAVIKECSENVGRCAPLAYIHNRGVEQTCHRLVDPINAFWLGILLCALLLIPVLFIAHHLMCLWQALHGYMLATAMVMPPGNVPCPVCAEGTRPVGGAETTNVIIETSVAAHQLSNQTVQDQSLNHGFNRLTQGQHPVKCIMLNETEKPTTFSDNKKRKKD